MRDHFLIAPRCSRSSDGPRAQDLHRPDGRALNSGSFPLTQDSPAPPGGSHLLFMLWVASPKQGGHGVGTTRYRSRRIRAGTCTPTRSTEFCFRNGISRPDLPSACVHRVVARSEMRIGLNVIRITAEAERAWQREMQTPQRDFEERALGTRGEGRRSRRQEQQTRQQEGDSGARPNGMKSTRPRLPPRPFSVSPHQRRATLGSSGT